MKSNPTDLLRLLAHMASADDEETTTEDEEVIEVPSARSTTALHEAFIAMTRTTRFNPGDTVCWKTLPSGGSLKNRNWPALGETAVVIEHLAVPLINGQGDSGFWSFHEPLDLVLGGDIQGKYVTFHFDARRFEKSQGADPTLQALTDAFLQPQTFTPGMLVTWKPGLANRTLPKVGQPMIVQAVLENPLHDSSKEASHPCFHEPLDLVGGFLDHDGEYLTYHYDSRRLMPYQVPEEPSTLPALPQPQRKGKRGKRDLVA